MRLRISCPRTVPALVVVVVGSSSGTSRTVNIFRIVITHKDRKKALIDHRNMMTMGIKNDENHPVSIALCGRLETRYMSLLSSSPTLVSGVTNGTVRV